MTQNDLTTDKEPTSKLMSCRCCDFPVDISAPAICTRCGLDQFSPEAYAICRAKGHTFLQQCLAEDSEGLRQRRLANIEGVALGMELTND